MTRDQKKSLRLAQNDLKIAILQIESFIIMEHTRVGEDIEKMVESAGYHALNRVACVIDEINNVTVKK